jgi:hypothetical protein
LSKSSRRDNVSTGAVTEGDRKKYIKEGENEATALFLTEDEKILSFIRFFELERKRQGNMNNTKVTTAPGAPTGMQMDSLEETAFL